MLRNKFFGASTALLLTVLSVGGCDDEQASVLKMEAILYTAQEHDEQYGLLREEVSDDYLNKLARFSLMTQFFGDELYSEGYDEKAYALSQAKQAFDKLLEEDNKAWQSNNKQKTETVGDRERILRLLATLFSSQRVLIAFHGMSDQDFQDYLHKCGCMPGMFNDFKSFQANYAPWVRKIENLDDKLQELEAVLLVGNEEALPIRESQADPAGP